MANEKQFLIFFLETREWPKVRNNFLCYIGNHRRFKLISEGLVPTPITVLTTHFLMQIFNEFRGKFSTVFLLIPIGYHSFLFSTISAHPQISKCQSCSLFQGGPPSTRNHRSSIFDTSRKRSISATKCCRTTR